MSLPDSSGATLPHPLSRSLCNPAPGQCFTLDKTKYVIGGKLGDGAAGVVRRVTRSTDGAEFALKFLAPDPKYIDESVFGDVANRFRREGEKGAKLRHEGLVTIHAFEDNSEGRAFAGHGPSNPFILMELVKGRTLEDYLRKEQSRAQGQGKEFVLTPEKLAIASHIGEALRYLHQRKLVHRDVKPANIFLPSIVGGRGQLPTAKLGDFGIMKWGDFQASVSTGTLTMTSQQGLGTLKYMSPEQAITPKDVTVRTDIYSFGITLFELFTGQILASPHHVFEVLNARLSRGNTASRFLGMGYKVAGSDIEIGEIVLEMHLRGPSGRPPIDRVVGRLQRELELRTGTD